MAGFHAARDRATALAASRDEAQHTGSVRERAVLRCSWSSYALRNGTAPTRGFSSSARGRSATCQLHLQEPAGFRVAHATALLRSLPLGSRRSIRACCTCAPCRAACNPSMQRRRALRRQEVSLLPRAAVVRRASCGLQELTAFRVARATAPLRSLPLGSLRIMRTCCACTPCRAGSGRSAH